MKKKVIGVLLVCAALLTSCGVKNAVMYSDTASNGASSGNTFSYDSSASEESYKSSDDYSEGDTVHAADTPEQNNKEIRTSEIDREMLVYSCTMNIDVLEFDKALEELRSSLNQFGGFVENETYSDGGSTGKWYYEDDEKWKSYKATVRIPSRVYDDFCDSAAALGDLRSKNASVDNLSAEYRDLSATLEIYEQKEERYINLLSQISDESQAVIIEDKLTEIQIEIARLKSRMDKINKDVAYSYVYLTVSEVKEYHSEPVRKDTFGQRFMNTLRDSASAFLSFLEDLLYVIIYTVPYLILFGLGIFVLVKIVKLISARKKKRKESLKMKEIKNTNEEKESEESKK